jgi:hypothetical protein
LRKIGQPLKVWRKARRQQPVKPFRYHEGETGSPDDANMANCFQMQIDELKMQTGKLMQAKT